MNTDKQSRIPLLGQMIIVRDRPAIVENIDEYSAFDENLHAVEVRYIDGWNYPESDTLIWEREWNPKAPIGDLIPKVFDTNPDDKESFINFINAYRWSTVNKVNIDDNEDNINLISPWQSAIQVEDYQLYPLLKALLMPRISLLLADDVGLGKTIEAGLIVSELISRGRLKRAMIICPASLQMQWKEELKEKFNLDFEIIDRKKLFELQREFGINTNPWTTYPKVITSMDYIRQPDVKESFKASCDKLTQNKAKLPWNMLIVDEAHNFNPNLYGENSQRYDLLKEIGGKFEHKLFLTATPHNGYTYAFTGLLELLDPVRFSQIDSLDDNYKKNINNVMIRRLKKDLNTKNKQRFATRYVESINLNLNKDELDLFELLREYKIECINNLKEKKSNDVYIAQFIFNLLTKRLLSDVYAFACTWWNRIIPESEELATMDEVNYAYRRTKNIVEDDGEKEQRENELIFKSNKWIKTISENSDQYILRISELLNKIGFSKCVVNSNLEELKVIPKTTKVVNLIKLLKEKIFVQNEYLKDERIIVFTEYKQTLNYLKESLNRSGFNEPYIDVLFGGMDTNKRQELKEQFNNEESNLKILLATDAASEGINLQNGCRYIVHYDIPWNPMRMEQRNGRVDRHGQRRDIYIYHFTSKDESDMQFLSKIVGKIDQVREDLGSVTKVLDSMLDKYFNSTDKKTVNDIDLLKLKTTLESNVSEADNVKAYQRLKATELQLSLSKENLFSLFSYVIKKDGGIIEEVEKDVYRITKIPMSWKGIIHDTLEVNKGLISGLPKITFNPEYFRKIVNGREFYINKKDTSLIRLAHPIMQKAMLEIKKELWDSRNINRWTLLEANLPNGIDEIIKIYVLVEVVNKLGEKIHQEVINKNYQIIDGELFDIDNQLEVQLNNLNVNKIDDIKERIDNLYIYEDELEESIREKFKYINEEKSRKLQDIFKEKLIIEKKKQLKLYNERLEFLKNDKIQKQIDKIIKKIEEETIKQNAVQLSLLDDTEVAIKENIKKLEKQKEILEQNVNATRELLKQEKNRVINEMLPQKYTISNLQVYPLGLGFILSKKEEN